MTHDIPDDAPISKEFLDRAHRKLCRQIAALIINAMAEFDVSYAQLGARLGVSPVVPKRWLQRMINGTATDLCEFSDLCTALNCSVRVSLHQIWPQGGDEQND